MRSDGSTSKGDTPLLAAPDEDCCWSGADWMTPNGSDKTGGDGSLMEGCECICDVCPPPPPPRLDIESEYDCEGIADG